MTHSEAPRNGQPKCHWVLVFLGRIALGSVEVFFLLFGIYLLILSYRSHRSLIVYYDFFASNLVIPDQRGSVVGACFSSSEKRRKMKERHRACRQSRGPYLLEKGWRNSGKSGAWSLQSLANETGLTASYISQIEKAELIPPVAVILQHLQSSGNRFEHSSQGREEADRQQGS